MATISATPWRRHTCVHCAGASTGHARHGVQATARKVYILLDTTLAFCTAATRALAPTQPPGATSVHAATAAARAAAAKAMALAHQFRDAVADLVTVLAHQGAQQAAAPQGAALLAALNYNAYYDTVLA